ncbi:MAG: flagellar biosynthesis protein FlhF [Gottschalkiaceae bacterium]|nr:MAG: flagellar biosynthesis protein FlhF [Gottschalkiaceae bacterium]
MKIKRFIGNTTQEAMYKLKKELGPEAIILHTRTIKQPGFLGIFKKNLVEVVAAVEENNKTYTRNAERLENSFNNNINNSRIESSINMKNDLEIEINKIKSMMESVVNTLDIGKSQLPDKLSKYLRLLTSNGVKEEIAFEILNKINDQINVSNKDNKTIYEIIAYNIKEYLGEPAPINHDGKQKIIFFVGPTGVGKTTTLAKIAAYFSLEKNYSIGMITSDTYRIAAVEQLKIYAEIMKIPLKVVYEIKDFYKSLSNFREEDLILVDTAGRNHKNIEQMNEIKELIESVNNKEVHLVINAATDMKTINDIFEKYSFIDDCKVIFTKIDEADNLGNVLNAKYYFNNKISYLTNGQNVPDDIEVPDMEKLSRKLIGELKDV